MQFTGRTGSVQAQLRSSASRRSSKNKRVRQEQRIIFTAPVNYDVCFVHTRVTTWRSSCSQVMKLRINGSGLQGKLGDAVNPSSSILHQESKQLQSVDAAQREFVNSTTRFDRTQ